MMNSNAVPNPSSEPYLVYHLTEKWNGSTLATALKSLLESTGDGSVSWGQVKKWIALRRVDINGNLCLDDARRVRTGDVLRFWHQSRPKPIEANDIRIVYADPHLVVVDKPPGVTSTRHARQRNASTGRRPSLPTLEELLPAALARMQDLQNLSPKGFTGRQDKTQRSRHLSNRVPSKGSRGNKSSLPARFPVFPVHRLDHHTSGLMMFARTRQVEMKLIAMFRKHSIHREYIGVCHGLLQPQTIRSSLVRDRGDGLRGSLPPDATPEQWKSAQDAVTHILGSKPLGDGRFSLFRCKLETGRTHQIRIHLSEQGHRLCGEQLYLLDSSGHRLRDDSQAPRQALHCDRLELVHPVTNEKLAFRSPWPRDLAQWIRSI